jgi:hypothetical protein
VVSPSKEGTPDVPAQVFENFIEELGTAGVASEVILRVRKTLLEDKVFTERALREAVLGDEPEHD